MKIAAGAGEVVTLSNITYMQDMSATVCNNSDENETKQLIDKRDGKPYIVTKLKDKNCWMTQNLEIINKTISSTDSDMLSGSFTIPSPSVSGFTTSDVAQPKAYYEAPYGGYYNWYTATAGAGTNSVSSGTLDQSICPKGWRLPPNTESGSYSNLLTSYGTYQNGTLFYGDQSILAQPLNFVYGGYVTNSSLNGAGEHGRYWSSTAYSIYDAYSLNFGTIVNPSNNWDRSLGYSVRCVAR